MQWRSYVHTIATTGERIRVAYPEGVDRNDLNATLRIGTGIAWSEIAQCICEPERWFQDNTIWLYMSIITMRAPAFLGAIRTISPSLTSLSDAGRHQTDMSAVGQSYSNSRDEPAIICIPVQVSASHWVLGIYIRSEHIIHYYNTNRGRSLTNETRELLYNIVLVEMATYRVAKRLHIHTFHMHITHQCLSQVLGSV